MGIGFVSGPLSRAKKHGEFISNSCAKAGRNFEKSYKILGGREFWEKIFWATGFR